MDPKKITIAKLQTLVDNLKSKDGDLAIGNYLYKGYRIQISKYQSSSTERYMRLYKRRRENGLCIRCGKKVVRKNPRTKKLYRLCDYHREITDKRSK